MITLSYILGLLQTDGNIYFLWENNKTLKPKITITQTNEKEGILLQIKNFLKSKEIYSSISGANLSIDRIDNIKNLIKLINDVQYCPSSDLKRKDSIIPLVGSKLRDFLALQKVIDLNDEKTNYKSSIQKDAMLAKMLDLKDKLTKDRIGPEAKTMSQWLKRLEKDENSFIWQDTAKDIWEDITKKTIEKGEFLLKHVKSNPVISASLSDFLLGCIDGDGSLQVNLITPPKDRTSPWLLKVEPLFTVTQEKKADLTNDVLFGLFLHLLGVNEFDVNIYKPKKDGNAERLSIDNRKALLRKNLIPFLETYNPKVKKTVERWKVFKKVLAMPELDSAEAKLKVVQYLQNSAIFKEERRSLTWKQVKDLINQQQEKR